MKKQTKELKKFLARVGLASVRVRNKYTAEADMFENIIYYSVAYVDKIKDLLKEAYKRKHHKIDVSMRTYGFLHELGHLLSKVEIKNLEKEMDAYNFDTFMLEMKDLEQLDLMMEYKKLKLEKLADKYAYRFYKQYEPLIKKLDKKLCAINPE